MKKLLSVLLAAMMLCGGLAVSVSADIVVYDLTLNKPKIVNASVFLVGWDNFCFEPTESGTYTIRIEGNFDSLVFALGNDDHYSDREEFFELNGSWSGNYSMSADESFYFTINYTTDDPYTIIVTTPDADPEPEPEPDPIFAFFAGFLPAGAANVLTWIVKYVFFGWLWGRWV